MSDAPFQTHADAALALLNTRGQFTRKAGSFLGELCVDPSPLSEKQLDWLTKLLAKANLPPLVTEP